MTDYLEFPSRSARTVLYSLRCLPADDPRVADRIREVARRCQKDGDITFGGDEDLSGMLEFMRTRPQELGMNGDTDISAAIAYMETLPKMGW